MSNKSSSHPHPKLGTFPSTAICANDILSSVLYVSGLVIPVAGVFAPVVMLFVGALLFLFRGVYREVVESMPINGGTYNALLNATTKNLAAVAGVLTILSYVATAVISAKSGVDYLFNWSVIKNSLPSFVDFNTIVIFGTIAVLLFFAFLVISGVKDSANVAIGIFSTHLVTLALLIILGFLYVLQNPSLNKFAENIGNTNHLIDNLSNLTGLTGVLPFLMLLILGFGTSLLGVSGFESSANFVEEQKEGVFKKTLTNMAIGVSIVNPLIALLFLSLFDLHTIHEKASYLLSDGALLVGGNLLQTLLVIDAFLVLCGAVLTSFVGISGLVSRMALDECFPAIFKKQNKKESYIYVIWGFFAFCVSILFVSGGSIPTLGGIYAISFLSVMCLFAIANLILKKTRTTLKRKYYFPSVYVIIALFFVASGLVVNIISQDGKLGEFANITYFLQYFVPTMSAVLLYMYRDYINAWWLGIRGLKAEKDDSFMKLTSGKYVAFIHRTENLYRILKYINENEVGRNLLLVHCKDESNPIKTYNDVHEALPILMKTGVFNHLSVQIKKIDMEFGAQAIDYISKTEDISKNRIFIGSIHDSHDFNYEDLGGVRIILA
jgi:amino acid transporter